MSDRTRRKRLVPGWLLPAMAAALVVLASAGGLVRVTYLASLVDVPDLVGRAEDVARDSARLSGLDVIVDTEQFSASVPAGSVIAQSPAAGTRVRSGSSVTVVLSAGTEFITMPDLTGFSLKDARDRLIALGIGVTTQDVASEAEAGTVLESFPAPGAQVRTGDTVRLSVATGGPSGDTLLPYDFTGLRVALDPEPVAGDAADVALEVSRRLRSLLEASGATVAVTRSLTASAPPVAERVSIVTSASPDACIGLSVSAVQATGITPVVVMTADTTTAELSRTMAAEFMSSVRAPERPVNAFITRADDVLGKELAPAMRVLLGDPVDVDDALRMTDPAWLDAVARSLYRALGETFAPR